MRANETISIQLYSTRLVEPLEAQFDLLKGLGFTNVEPWGGLLADTQRLKDNLQRCNMKASSIHVGVPSLRADAQGAARACRGLGIATLYAPAPPADERTMDLAQWKSFARELAGFARVVTEEGLRFGWHNHHWEFQPTADGTVPMDVLLAEVPDMVWEVDLAWAVRGGADPLTWLKKYADHIDTCHIKDLAPSGECVEEDGWADVGHGTMNWAALLPAMRTIGVNLFVLEHDKPSDAARFVRRSMATLKSWN